ncbi:MAG TPA: NRDE family protein [Desulfuromonadales bacterium]|nr:NRDE family protein [Desulfuromonadales bacterium]
MCLILFAHKVHPDYPLVLAGNRDEFYDRPTAPAAFWADAPEILAGRDLVGGGTWLGITRAGRLATVANYRQPAEKHVQGLSRGLLTVDFLCGASTPQSYLETVARLGEGCKGFNLLVADGDEFAYYSNRDGVIRRLTPGIYGLSNALLDTPWPKVAQGKAALEGLLTAGPPELEALLAILADTSRPADHLLPDTGVGLERERLLSSRFIASPDYGTRASTVVLVDRTGRVTFVERSFDRSPQCWQEVRHHFRLQK